MYIWDTISHTVMSQRIVHIIQCVVYVRELIWILQQAEA